MKETIQTLKHKAAEYAVQFVEDGMVIGLGGGSTAVLALYKIAELLKSGELKNILGIPCSTVIEKAAIESGIPLTTLGVHPVIDLTIDGADEVDPNFNLVKGGGGALLREKIVAQASKREIIIVDDSKLSPIIGTHWPLPIEVIPYGWKAQLPFLEGLGGKPKIRLSDSGEHYLTDQGNYILDCAFGAIDNPVMLNEILNERAGIVEHGLFIDLATDIIVASDEGIQHLTRPS
jgi:ribose 5-phosphate isomerase A